MFGVIQITLLDYGHKRFRVGDIDGFTFATMSEAIEEAKHQANLNYRYVLRQRIDERKTQDEFDKYFDDKPELDE